MSDLYNEPQCHLCPIQENCREIVQHSEGSIKNIQQLQRDLQDCPQCVRYEDCPFLQNFNAMVDRAIEQVVEEWNLASILDP